METMTLSDVQEFKDEIATLTKYEAYLRRGIEYYRRHLSILQTIAEKNERVDIAELVSFNHHVILNSLLPVLGTIEQGNSRAHLMAQRAKE